MAQWVPALMMILCNYEGIELTLELAEQPLNYLAGVLPDAFYFILEWVYKG